MLSRRRATAVVRANWWDGGRLEHLVGPLALHTYVAPALHTPWGSALNGFGSALSMGCAHLHGFGSAHSMGSAHSPWLWLCALHGLRTLPMALALHTPWAPRTSHGFGSAHSMELRTLPVALALRTPWGSAHSHRFYCVAPRRHITKLAFPFCDCPVQEAQRHVKPPPRDSSGKGELVGRRSA